MGGYKKKFLGLFSLIIIIALLAACTSKDDRGEEVSDGSFPEEIAREDIDYEDDRSEESSPIVEGEKVISTYFLSIETMDFENSREALNDLIDKHKAFIENSNVGFRGYEYSKNYRYADFSIRIPKDKLEAFKKDLDSIGYITDESTSKEDVSKFYRDTESRLNLVSSKEKRLLELLEKASEIEDIIAIESELTNTIAEKEMLERDLKSIDERIDYTILNLNLLEVRSYSNIDRADSSLLLRLKNAFKDSFYSFALALQNFLVWLVYALPYIVILGLLAIVMVFLIRKRRNKKL